jgi:hypothetical protein
MIGIVNALLSGVSGGSTAFTQGGTTIPSPSSGFTETTASSILPIAAIVVEVLAVFVVMAVVGLFIIVVVANRADPDPTGRRPQAVYYFAVSFVTLVTTILGSLVVVFSLVQLIGNHGPGLGDATARSAVLGALIAIASGVLLRTHLQRGVSLTRSDVTNPSKRVGQSYVSAVAFLSVLILLVVTIMAIYMVFALIGPGVFGSFGGRTAAGRFLIDAVYAGLVAGFVLRAHRNLVTPGLQFFRRSGGNTPAGSAPLGAAPFDQPG